jgi:hypothetical protein
MHPVQSLKRTQWLPSRARITSGIGAQLGQLTPVIGLV